MYAQAAILTELMQPDRMLTTPVVGVYSVLPDAPVQRYDRYAKTYDRLIGNRFYNQWMWQIRPTDYTTFAAEAVGSAAGLHLDAGCGSLVSTATVYANTERVCILCDISLGMLQAGRKRLLAITGTLPANIIFLQADLLDLPFRPNTFATVGSLGMFHIFADVQQFAATLHARLTPDGALYFSSLVAETPRATKMLARLHKMGEVGAVRSAEQLQNALPTAQLRVQGAMAFGQITS